MRLVDLFGTERLGDVWSFLVEHRAECIAQDFRGGASLRGAVLVKTPR
ncbi:MAG: hypothetical protein ACREQY_11775 [Candidatus Binatia bacterium]